MRAQLVRQLAAHIYRQIRSCPSLLRVFLRGKDSEASLNVCHPRATVLVRGGGVCPLRADKSRPKKGVPMPGKNLVTATVSVRGVRPLLWHHFTEDALPLEKVEKEGVAGNDPTEWQRTVLKTKTGQLYVEPAYIFGSLREAAKYTRKAKFSIQPAVSATLQVDDERILVDRFMPKGDLTTNRDKPVYLDVRAVKNPSTRGRNIRYRVAAAPGWKLTFHITWDRTVVSKNEMHAVAIDAGRLVGVGSGRSIGMGRFHLTSFKVREDSRRAVGRDPGVLLRSPSRH